jgi:hypothetical protein
MNKYRSLFFILYVSVLHAGCSKSTEQSPAVAPSNAVTTNLPSEAAAAIVDSRLIDPYWAAVYVNHTQARNDVEKKRAHIIDGLNWQIEYMYGFSSFSQESKDGIRFAYVSEVSNKLPMGQFFNCEKKLTKFDGKDSDGNENQWIEVKPKTVTGNILVHVCSLATSYSGN